MAIWLFQPEAKDYATSSWAASRRVRCTAILRHSIKVTVGAEHEPIYSRSVGPLRAVKVVDNRVGSLESHLEEDAVSCSTPSRAIEVSVKALDQRTWSGTLCVISKVVNGGKGALRSNPKDSAAHRKTVA